MERAERAIRAVLALVLVALGLVAGATTATAAEGDIGFEGPSYVGTGGTGYTASSDKPQSKLWRVGDTWFSVMFHQGLQEWHIFRLDRAGDAEQWVDTEVPVDERNTTLADTLWDGTHLYIASHYVTAQTSVTEAVANNPVATQPAELYRFSYDSGKKTFTPDWEKPAIINNTSSESLTIDKDSTGRLWATWTQVTGSSATGYTTEVYVNSATDGGATWGQPDSLDNASAEVVPDDISAIVAFDDRIGVLWSNHLDNSFHWAMHDDGAPLGEWSYTVASSEPRDADDHMSIKTLQSDSAGRVYAAVKTGADGAGSSSAALIKLLTFTPTEDPTEGTWDVAVFGTVADCHTRPVVVLDETNRRVHVFATGPSAGRPCDPNNLAGVIYHKSAPMDGSEEFESGLGEPVIVDADSPGINDVTSTKQSVTGTSDLVILATNAATKRYWHARIDIAGGSSTPTDPGTPTPTPGTPTPGTPTPGTPAPGTPTPGTQTPAPGTPTAPVDRRGSWFYLNDSNTGEANTVLSYGDSSDTVLVADTDGRNGDSLLIRRGNQYFVRNTLSTGVAEYTFFYGNPGDTVLVGDWNGDGQDTLMVRRGNTYFVKNTTTTGVADSVFAYGDPGDTVLVGDWDGDGVDTLAVRRGNTYFLRNSLSSGVADRVITYGDPGDTVHVGRWNGSTTGLAVQRGNTFFLKNELTSGVADVVFGYGDPGDTVLVGDWNGDGVDSLGVRRIG